MCFKCKERPAGNEYGGSYSAYCGECQHRAGAGPQPRGKQCGCAACGLLFWTLADFDRHQVRVGGVFTGECLAPASLGLELAKGAWGTPEGNVKRAETAARLLAGRSSMSQAA